MIAIRLPATGEIQFIEAANAAGYPGWVQYGPALPVGVQLPGLTLVGEVWVEDPARVQAALIAQVKLDNEARVRTLYSTNYGKQKKYSRKQQEVMDFRALASTVTPLTTVLTQTVDVLLPAFGGLSVAAQRKKFRFAMAEAAKRNVTVAVIIGEYEAAIDTVESQVADWEAIELEAVRAIKATATAAAKRAVYAAINWNWKSM